MAKGKKWILVKQFDGLPKRTDMEIQEFDIPPVKDGEVLLETVVLTVDPYMRFSASNLNPSDTMMGDIIGRVLESKDINIKVGEIVNARSGWVSHAVVKGKGTIIMPNLPEGAPLSLALGILGMPGMSAYFGLLDVCKLKPTDTVFVNAAAGAVGTVVGQIAKIKGCKVIGSVGSDEKVKYLKEELGFDETFNYKIITPDKLDATLKELVPEGIDVFFENVGGEASSVIYGHMNKNGRAAISGTISNYNSPENAKPKVSEFIHLFIYYSISVQGFIVFDFLGLDLDLDGYSGNSTKRGIPAEEFYLKRQKVLSEMMQWMKEGKLRYREHIYEGFESMYDVFMSLFHGKNIGKVVVNL